MREIFNPNSVAVIGVSAKADNLGRNIVSNLIEFGYAGSVYAVGPSGGVVATHKIYPTVSEIPDPIDLAVILTPASTVPGIMEECGKKGVRWAIIETAGFREYGEEGGRLEQSIAQIAEQYGIRFVGPNCIGIINMENGFGVPFLLLKKFVKPGEVSMITQSGGVGLSVLNLMVNEGIGLNKFASVGNMLDVTAEDLLDYLVDDPGTKEIFLYLESLRDGRRLMEIGRRSSKPILVFKSNIGQLGKTIAASHTASLSSDDKVVDAAFRQADIVRVRDATSLLNNLKCLRLPPMRGKRLAVISRSGGHAVVAADASELSGLALSKHIFQSIVTGKPVALDAELIEVSAAYQQWREELARSARPDSTPAEVMDAGHGVDLTTGETAPRPGLIPEDTSGEPPPVAPTPAENVFMNAEEETIQEPPVQDNVLDRKRPSREDLINKMLDEATQVGGRKMHVAALAKKLNVPVAQALSIVKKAGYDIQKGLIAKPQQVEPAPSAFRGRHIWLPPTLSKTASTPSPVRR